jgi:hypothetical protein
MAKRLIITHTDDTTHEINIDLAAASMQLPIGAKANHPGYLNLMAEAGAGYIKGKDTDNPEFIGGSQIKKVNIDLGKNLSYEQEFLNKK